MTRIIDKMTTRNAKAIIANWQDEGCDVFLEARIDTVQPKNGYMISFIPGYDGQLYATDQRLLHLSDEKGNRAKMIKTREAIQKLAKKFRIPISRIIWR